jgi:purine-nucleoside phosphorylase
LEAKACVSYKRIPGFAPVGVVGHPGELVIGRLAGVPIMLLKGRTHYYEGHSMARVSFAVRAMAEYGIRDLLLTNAAGAINPGFQVGDLMVLKDHLNFMGINPLRGPPVSHLPQFVDLSDVYDARLRRLLQRAGRACHVRLRSGVYLAVSGPSYETPAEIRAFRKMGADAVGMSTVPEAIVARQCGLRVAAISCVTNLAAGLTKIPLSHDEVLARVSHVKDAVGKMLARFAMLYGHGFKDSD